MLKKLCLAYVLLFTCLSLIFALTTWYTQPIAVVVPHHDIVKDLRQNFLQRIAGKRIRTKTIILLAPDHFSSNQHQISYTDRTWKLSNGQFAFDSDIASGIVADFEKDDFLVSQDHGIFNVLPDIKSVFPDTKVVPILIGQEVAFTKLNGFVEKLSEHCQSDCLLITSVDFSHYLPSTLANIHDAETISKLAKLNISSDFNVEVDSPQSLYVLTQFAKLNQAEKWTLFSHTNSGEIADSRDAETTSHVMGSYQKSFFTPQQFSDSNTFFLATNVDEERDVSSFGKRFFYGVDDVELKFQGEKNLNNKVKIVSNGENNSFIEFVDKVVTIHLGGDLAIAGLRQADSIQLVFLPLTQKDDSYQLMRGEEKTRFFERLFDSVPDLEKVMINLDYGVIEFNLN